MTAFTLKIIALSAMLFDHLAVVFPFWFRGIGRLAWPIFAYLLAEGFQHTKSPEKFLMRLLAFALISEIPYDLAMGNEINFFANTNIFYTLFLSGTAIWLYERFRERRNWKTMAVIASILPTVILAEILSVDYGSLGVLFVFVLYAVKPKIIKLLAVVAFAILQFAPLVVSQLLLIKFPTKYFFIIPFALTTVPLLAKYNGERGYAVKWLFYWFYPAHLAVLALISVMANGFPWG